MGEVELLSDDGLLIMHSIIYFYGNTANEDLGFQVAKNIQDHWNEPGGMVSIKLKIFRVVFDIQGFYAPDLTPEIIFENTDPRNN